MILICEDMPAGNFGLKAQVRALMREEIARALLSNKMSKQNMILSITHTHAWIFALQTSRLDN